MENCDYCGKTINELPWTCKRCGQTFCSEHRLPENHNCKGLEEDKKRNQEKWKRVAKEEIEKIYEKEKETPLIPENYIKSQKSKTKSYGGNYEMYVPGRKKHHSHHNRRSFSSKNFLSKYIYPRIQGEVKPHLMQFLYIFLIGLVLNYAYYQTFSLSYLFIGGVQEWFNVLIPTLNGFSAGYNLFYLIINGIYYAYFYYSLVLVIYHTITNLDKRDTWVMLGWFAVILWILIHFFPQIV